MTLQTKIADLEHAAMTDGINTRDIHAMFEVIREQQRLLDVAVEALVQTQGSCSYISGKAITLFSMGDHVDAYANYEIEKIKSEADILNEQAFEALTEIKQGMGIC